MSIIFHTLSEESPAPHKTLINKCLKNILSEYDKIMGDINIIMVDDQEILELNRKYLNHNFYTDIITFNFNSENKISGDLFVSFERIKENATKFNCSYNVELSRVIIHGIFHLLGFEDKTKEQKNKMRLLEDNALDLIYPSLKK